MACCCPPSARASIRSVPRLHASSWVVSQAADMPTKKSPCLVLTARVATTLEIRNPFLMKVISAICSGVNCMISASRRWGILQSPSPVLLTGGHHRPLDQTIEEQGRPLVLPGIVDCLGQSFVMPHEHDLFP